MMKLSQVFAASLLLASSFLISSSASLTSPNPPMGFCRSILRSGIPDTAKRRYFFSALHSPVSHSFVHSKRTSHLQFAPHNFIHTDELPWTPIKENTRSIPPTSSKILPYNRRNRLQMNPHNTEGFREATRGGQGYITPRGGKDGLDDHGNRGAGRRGQPLKTRQTSKEVFHFPKLSPGHQHDINAPPPVKPSEDEVKQQQARIIQMKERQEARGTARLNILAEKVKKKPLMVDNSDQSVVDLTVGEEVCNALDARSKEHCLENFRDGRESAQFMKVIGQKSNGKQSNNNQVVTKSIGDSAVASLDFLDEEDDDEPLLIENDDESKVSIYDEIDDKIDEILADEKEKEPVGEKVGQSSIGSTKVDRFEKIRGPLSEGFRNGARMATYKQPEFGQVRKSTSTIEVDGDNDDEYMLDKDSGELFEDLELDDDDELIDGGGVFKRDSIDYDEEEVGFEELDVNGASTSGSSTKLKPAPTLNSIDPTSIEILPLDEVKKDDDILNDELISPRSELSQSILDNLRDPTSGSFVKMFRGSASYIANHRSTLAVFHIPGELLAWEGFSGLMDDIALTWLLGMKIVLVAGCRHQIDIRLEDEDDSEHHIGGKVMMSSIRVTDEDTLRVVKEEAGFVRFEIERRMAKSLRMHGGLVKGSENLVGNVVSGNFYSAQPFGVLDGIDYCSTGFPRKIEIERIRQVHESNDIVLLTSLGVSPSGEIFNVNSEFLAATAAGALGASKIIYFNVHGTSFQNKRTGKPVQNLRVSDAKNLLEHYKMRIHPKGFALVDLDEDSPHQAVLRTPGSMETLIKVGYSMVALEKGVKRAHILAPENGALVQELYTRDGCGTLISRDIYEGIRRADVNDVSGIYDLIDPLVQQGTLVERPKSQLEKEVLSYYVYTRDGLVVATGQLKRFEGGYAEIGCLVVSKDYRRGGRGDAMLGYLERMALQCGASKVFVLSTQTMEWFVERGFKEVPVASLPPSRQALYNTKRKSKIYMKEINGDRDLDAAELWWSNK